MPRVSTFKFQLSTLFFLLLPLLFAGCGQAEITDNMSDEEILKVLDVKLHRNPDNDALLFQRGQAYLRLGRVNEAINDLSRATSLQPKEVKYFMALGDAQFANGDVEASYNALNKALELEPDNADAILKMGELTYYSRDYDRALDYLSRVTAHDPNNRTALFMKAFVYKEKGDTSNAVGLLEKVCGLYPDYEPAFEELGVLYASRHADLALEYLNTALRLEPRNTNALYALAMYYQELNQADKAEEYYKQILDIDANHKHAWHNRGYIQLFTYGDYEQAVDYLTRAIQCDTNFIEAWTNRGCAYELLGDKPHAREDFQHALSLDHTFQPALDGMKRI